MKTSSMIKIILLTISIFFNTGCEKDKNTVICDCDSINTLIVDSKLQDTWYFKSFEKLSGKEDKVPSKLKEMYIDFKDSTLSVKGQNNTCEGNCQAYDNNCLKISNLACTEVGGTKEQMEWENRFVIGLNQVECYEINQNKLKIYYKEDGKQKIMHFKK